MRLRTPIAKFLRTDPLWKAASDAERAAFRDRMRGRQYGHEATRDAWLWFHEGWHSGHGMPEPIRREPPMTRANGFV
jgi:hypothetical protein